MITLGINAAFHDSAAALVAELPFHAIDHCLREAGVALRDVDHVAYSADPARFVRGRVQGDMLALPLAPSAHDAGPWESVWDPLFACHLANAPRQLASGAPHHLKQRFAGVRHDGRAFV